MNYITADLPNNEYHAMAGISSSHFKTIDKSPLHYWSKYINPERKPSEPTDAMIIGTAWHTGVFEPAQFQADYVCLPEGIDRRTKEGKALFAEIEASGKVPFKPDQYNEITRMVDVARAHPILASLLNHEHVIFENSIFIDDESGVTLKIRPDLAIMPCEQFPHGLILDGKSTNDASPTEFGRSYWNLGYHYQAAFYCDVWQTFWKTEQHPPFIYFSQEKTEPFATAMYKAEPKMIDFGRKKYRAALDKIIRCKQTNHWPSYHEGIENLTLPVWAEKEIEGESK